MLSDQVLAGLRRLNRQSPVLVNRPAHSGSHLRPNAAAAATVIESASADTLAALPEGREVATDSGAHWLIETPIEQLWPAGPRIMHHHEQTAMVALGEMHPELERLAHSFPRRTVYLDLETCGFAGSMVFLVGVICRQDDQLVLQQLLARNYAEERAILESLWETMRDARVLVTFNGKTFDWPTVQDRTTVHRLNPTNQPAPASRGLASRGLASRGLAGHGSDPPANEQLVTHCDLLHHSRRRWKKRLPNCRLQTLERYICGRRRIGDIPGRDIPLAYHDYVRSGDAYQLRSILHHNALDLVTLLELGLHLTQDGDGAP